MEKIKLKLEYKKLVREGLIAEADKKLREIYSLEPNIPNVVPVNKKEKEVPKKEKEISDELSLNELTKIKGIGKKTLKDLKRIYSSIGELKEALKEDKVPLNDNIVKKLNKFFD